MDTPNYPKQNNPQTPPILTLDRPKPCNIDAEVAVLGAMLNSKEAATTAFSALRFEGAFFRPAHQTIFDAMLELNNESTSVSLDLVVLGDHLSRSGRLKEIGGRAYLNQLMDSCPTAAHIEHYVEIVRQNAVLRRIISTCSEAIAKCYDSGDDVNQVLDQVEQQVFDIASLGETQKLLLIRDLAIPAFEYIRKVSKGDQSTFGIQTGFDFDQYTTGLKPGELFVLAARPSIGKTALALNMATNIVLQAPRPGEKNARKKGVGIFSLEMPAMQLVIRILCAMGNVSLSDLRKKSLTQRELLTLGECVTELQKANLIIDDTGALDILELRAKARRMVQQHQVDVIFIDYLQLIRGHVSKNASRENEVAMISGSLKAMAKELNIPVVVLAQLNRAAEQNPKEKPKLANLRESGAIEQDADVVALLHRDRADQYNAKEDNPQLKAELIIAKNRNGATGTQELAFFPKITKFANAAFGDFQEPEGEQQPHDKK